MIKKALNRKKRRLRSSALAIGGAVFMTLFAPVPSYPFGSSEPGIMEAQAATTFSQYWFQDELGNWKVKNGNMVSAGLVQDATGNYFLHYTPSGCGEW